MQPGQRPLDIIRASSRFPQGRKPLLEGISIVMGSGRILIRRRFTVIMILRKERICRLVEKL